MIDLTALAGMVREAIGSASVDKAERDGSTGVEFGAIARCIAYMLGGTYTTSDWSALVSHVRAITSAGAWADMSDAEIKTAVEPVTGALLTLAEPANVPAVYEYAESESGTYAIIRTENGSGESVSVWPGDADWLRACGYVQSGIIGSVVRSLM